MIARLTKQGAGWALLFEGPLPEELPFEPDTPLEVTTAGGALVVRPLAAPERRAKFEAALADVNRKYERVLKKLAE